VLRQGVRSPSKWNLLFRIKNPAIGIAGFLSYFRNTLPFKDKSEKDAFIEALRKAGLPE